MGFVKTFSNLKQKKYTLYATVVTPNTQVVQAAEQKDLITQLITAPWIWLVLITAIIGFVIIKLQSGKKKPEEQPFYGYKVRKEVTTVKLKTRNKIWGYRVNWILYKGFLRAGKVIKVEPIIKILKNNSEMEIWNVSFRGFGFWNWIKAVLLGRYETLVMDPCAGKIDNKKKTLTIHPKAFLWEDSGVWTMGTEQEKSLVADLNTQLDLSNLAGFGQDYLRRISSQHPEVSKTANILSHEADLEEKKRKNRVSGWAGS